MPSFPVRDRRITRIDAVEFMTDHEIREDIRELAGQLAELSDGDLLSNVHICEAALGRIARLLAASRLHEDARREAGLVTARS